MMSLGFWIKRATLVLVLSFFFIAGAQYLKTKDTNFALGQGAMWGAIATTTYLVVLWRKLRKNPACAVRAENESRTAR
jgi:hypothetical protein